MVKTNKLMWLAIAVVFIIVLSQEPKIKEGPAGTTGPPGAPGTTTIKETTIIEKLDNPPPPPAGVTCTLTFTPDILAFGQTTNGRLEAEPNTACNAYVNYNNGGWMALGLFITGGNGLYTETRTPTLPGSYMFAAICGSCITNYAQIIVTNPPPGQDSDGDGWEDQIELNQGTDPFDSGSHPEPEPEPELEFCNDVDKGHYVDDYSTFKEASVCYDAEHPDGREDYCTGGQLIEWYCPLGDEGTCDNWAIACELAFGPKWYCRFGACFEYQTQHPASCDDTCGTFTWYNQMASFNYCQIAAQEFCSAAGQGVLGSSYLESNNCCCWNCI